MRLRHRLAAMRGHQGGRGGSPTKTVRLREGGAACESTLSPYVCGQSWAGFCSGGCDSGFETCLRASIVLRRRLREEGLSCILFTGSTELCTRLQYLNKKKGGFRFDHPVGSDDGTCPGSHRGCSRDGVDLLETPEK